MRISNFIKSFKKIKSIDDAISMELNFRENIYGDKINKLNCRSIWVDKYFFEYKCEELYWEVGDRVMCKHGYLGGRIGTILIVDAENILIELDNENAILPWQNFHLTRKLCRVNGNEIFKYDDKVEQSKKEKRKEELRLKYIAIDPYGEENWEE